MKSTVVDESLSSFKPMYCSREYQASTRLIQQYEKSTLNYRYISLKWGLTKYPACMSFIVIGKCVPLITFLWITSNILFMSACLGKYFCTSLPLLVRLSNPWGSWQKWFIRPLVCFQYYTLLKWWVFFKFSSKFWVNVHFSWKFWHRYFTGLGGSQ